MSQQNTHVEHSSDLRRPLSPAELIDRLSRFQGPPQEFLVNLLAVQCRLSGAQSGAILRPGPQGRVDVLAVYPPVDPGQTAPPWLAQAVQSTPRAIRQGSTLVQPLAGSDDLYGQPAREHLVVIPLKGGPQGVRGVAAFRIEQRDPLAIGDARARLELTVSLLSLYEMRLTLQRRQTDLSRLRTSLEVLAAFNAQKRFNGAAMALCNEIASRWQCERVSFGLLKGRYVKLKALSHTEKTNRRMQLVQDIEAVMEECLDQDLEVIHPAGAEATFVSRSAKQLATRHGPTTVLTLPLREDGEPQAALTIERAADEPVTAEEAEALRLTCDLVAPRLLSLARTDRWAGARAATAVRSGAAALVGPRHTWVKLAALGVFGFILFLVFAHGTYTADADFTILPQKRRVLAAPFQDAVRWAYVEPGDSVVGAENPSWRLDEAAVRSWPVLRAALAAPADATTPLPPALTGGPLAGSHEQLWWALGAARRRAGPAAADGEPNWQALRLLVGPLDAPPPEPPCPARRLRELLGDDVVAVLDAAGPRGLDAAERQALLAALNDLLQRGDLYDEAAWADLAPSARQRDLLGALRRGRLVSDRIVELNRSLLAAAFPEALAPGATVLAEMDTAALREELATARTEHRTYLLKRRNAQKEGKTGEAQLYRAQEEGALAQIDLHERRLREARIVSPISGKISQGDWRDLVGREVQRGDVLFEVAQVDRLRAELAVPEDQIRDVVLDGKGGMLATKSYPGISLPFTIERISPSAEVRDNENVFRARASLDAQPAWLLPGMEGLARVDLGRRRYAYIWTRKFVNWVRMKLWW